VEIESGSTRSLSVENSLWKRHWNYSKRDNSTAELRSRVSRIQNLGPTRCMRQFSVLMQLYSSLNSSNTKHDNGNKQARTHVTRGCDKDITAHWITAYRRSENTAPSILKLNTTWRWVVNFTPPSLYPFPDGNIPRYPLNSRLG